MKTKWFFKNILQHNIILLPNYVISGSFILRKEYHKKIKLPTKKLVKCLTPREYRAETR